MKLQLLLALTVGIFIGGGYVSYSRIVTPTDAGQADQKAYGGYSRIATPTDASEADQKTVKVERGPILLSVSTTGNVVMPRQAKLTFGSKGIVKEVMVKDGRLVKKGEVLSRLDARPLQQAADLARANLLAAEEALKDAREPYTTADIAKSRTAVQDAQAKLKTAQDELRKAREPYTPADIAKARASLQAAQAAVSKAHEDLWDAQNPYDANDIASAEAAVRQAEEALVSADKNVTLTALTNQAAVRDAIRNLMSSQARRSSLAEQERLQQDLELVEMKEAKGNADARDTLAKARDTLRDAQAKLDEIRKGPKGGEVAVKQGALLQARANFQKAQEDLDEILKGADPIIVAAKEAAVALAQASLQKAQEDLDKMVPDPVVVAVREQQAKKAREDLEEALDNLKKATLTAPFDGVVATVSAEEGLEIGANAVAVLLVDTSQFEVEANIDEVDVLKLRQGQEVSVTLDALPGERLRGVVDRLSPVATRQQGVIIYKVNLSLTIPASLQLREGLTAQLSMVALRKDNVLRVPAPAVKVQGRRGTVQVMVSGKPQAREVKVGERNETWVEIVEGLKEGDEVVVQASANQPRPGR